ncbi:YpjP family protein [Neobacillus sp. Marseille-QA0830]
MYKWLRKTLFVMVSVLTFGLVTPTQLMNPAKADSPTDRDAFEIPSPGSYSHVTAAGSEESEFNRDSFVEFLLKQAEDQSYQKFGSRIKPVIEDEFRDVILPNIELAIEETASRLPDEQIKNLAITEQPGSGYSEKIFHIKNHESGKDILRFHVRRDQPPQEGYWFNFHYHTYEDDFQTHHQLGSIYWAKDTPPKWMC